MEFSKNLSRERKARGLSQEELAARLHVYQKHLLHLAAFAKVLLHNTA